MLVSVFCDASWCQDTGAAGWGCWIKSDRGREEFAGAFRERCQQANEAEAKAVANAVYWAIKSGLAQNGDTLLIQTDCQAVVDAFYNRVKVSKNKAVLEAIREARSTVNKYGGGIILQMKHVKGHSKSEDPRFAINKMCDKAAKKYMKEVRKCLTS